MDEVIWIRRPTRRFLVLGVWFNVLLTAILLILDLYFHWGR